MKGLPGLLIALGFGVLGALCNWLYIDQKSRDFEKVEFVAIADGVTINAGDRFKRTDFAPVSIPRISVGNLDKAAFQFRDVETLVDMPAIRSFTPGEIVLRQDLRTPPLDDIRTKLNRNELLMWVPVDTRTFVTALVNPGDEVSFIVPRLTPAPANGDTASTDDPTRMLGPFRILSVGNRMGSLDALRAAGMTQQQENVLSIAVTVRADGTLDDRGQELARILRLTNFQSAQVYLHPKPEVRK
jgi:hypothetical protein